MKNLILLSAIAAASVSVPVAYQGNPELFHSLLRMALASEQPETQPVARDVAVKRVGPEARAPLSGHRVRLDADAKGHFFGDFKLNGRSQDAMIDTGATLVAINRSTARRVGLQLTASDFRYRVKTANGETAAAGVTLSELAIGRIRIRDVQAVVLEDAALDTTLIGMSFLNRLSSFKVEDGSLLLEQ